MSEPIWCNDYDDLEPQPKVKPYTDRIMDGSNKRSTARRQTSDWRGEEMKEARMAWLEQHSTLHTSVDILYVVDGYEVQVLHEDGVTELSPRFRGATLGEAIDAAIASQESPPTAAAVPLTKDKP